MTIGVLKNSSLFAVVQESTEGVAELPSVGTEFIQVLDAVESTPAKELIERAVITPNKGKIQPRVSTSSVAGSIPTEFKGSGTEGQAPETDVLWKSLLGVRRDISARITTGTGHSTNTLNIVGHSLEVGDIIVILEANNYWAAAVESVDGVDDITFYPTAPFTPSDGVELAKTVTYRAEGNAEPSFTFNAYWGNEILQQDAGCKVSSCSIENITTGQTPNANFAYEGLSFDESDASAAIAPSYDPALPPLALSMVVAYNDVCLDMNELSLSIENTISFLTSVKSEDGRVSSRVSERSVSGSLTPYMDDTDLTLFDIFKDNQAAPLFVTAYNVDPANDGQFELGSMVAYYCPNTLITGLTKGDQEGTLTRPVEFQANTGATGDKIEIFVGFC
jgi:hypothetical protein